MALLWLEYFDLTDSDKLALYKDQGVLMALNVDKKVAPAVKGLPQYGTHFSPATATVSMEKKLAGQSEAKPITESQKVHPGISTDGHAITVEAGRTLNLGNYESARIGVTLTVPTTKAELSDAFDWASEWVSDRVEQAVKDAKGE